MKRLLVLPALCALGINLGKDPKTINDEYRVSGIIENADNYACPVRAMVVEWSDFRGHLTTMICQSA